MKIAEATIIWPVTFLITLSLAGLAMSFYNDFLVQLDENRALQEKMYQVRECSCIRVYDRAKDVVES